MRKVKISRKTKETDITLELNLDGRGKYNINTSVPFFDHMMSAFCLHGNFDLSIKAKGDTDIDQHHLIEDIGIVLGQAIKKCLKNKKNIVRFGNFLLPMDEALSYVVIDISNRPYLKYKVRFKKQFENINFDFGLIKEFFKGLVNNAGITLQVSLLEGENNHHIAESIFKGFAKALYQATRINKKISRVSTKGKL